MLANNPIKIMMHQHICFHITLKKCKSLYLLFCELHKGTKVLKAVSKHM